MPDGIDFDEIADQIVTAGTEWADKDAAARHLEETKQSVRAEIAVRLMDGGSSAAKAEARALADAAYKLHIHLMVEARHKANIARVMYDGMRLKVDMIRTEAATKRVEMNLAGGR